MNNFEILYIHHPHKRLINCYCECVSQSECYVCPGDDKCKHGCPCNYSCSSDCKCKKECPCECKY